MVRMPVKSYPLCSHCAQHVELETDYTDEQGHAVHEDCYVALLLTKCRIFASTGHSLLILNALAVPKNERQSLNQQRAC